MTLLSSVFATLALMELHIIHIPKQGAVVPVDLSSIGSMVFETCLRQIIFLNSDSFISNLHYQRLQNDPSIQVETFKGSQAYQFALEVICGLHSLIKGETEIFGQFKDFAGVHKNTIEAQSLLNDVFKQLIIDCKALRGTRIQNWNHNTYGSVTRKLLGPNDGVAMIGAGQLAQEIAPWLKLIKNKYLIVRRPQTLPVVVSSFMVEMTHSLKPSLAVTVVVVAAGIDNADLSKLTNLWPNLRLVIDWRGDQRWVSKNNESVFHLHDLKEQDEQSKNEQTKRIELVSADIQIKALEFNKKAKHNPWGWEDFCA